LTRIKLTREGCISIAPVVAKKSWENWDGGRVSQEELGVFGGKGGTFLDPEEKKQPKIFTRERASKNVKKGRDSRPKGDPCKEKKRRNQTLVR